jgi:hypothetical protein
MSPLTIYQDALDRVSRAVLAADFATYLAQIDLPYLLHTETTDFLLTTEAELRPTFDALSQGLIARGVTHYERVARSAEFARPDRIEGLHFTHMIACGDRVAPPHSSRHVLVRRGDRWLFSEAHYPIATNCWPLSDSALFADPSRQESPEAVE